MRFKKAPISEGKKIRSAQRCTRRFLKHARLPEVPNEK